jgi:hypothetical protein
MAEEERPPAPSGVSLFERIRHTNAAGAEYWSSRDFAQALGYSDYRAFGQTIVKARADCFNSGRRVEDHFVEITEPAHANSGARRSLKTILLSRYACYLTLLNANPSREMVALGQSYFTIRNLRQRLTDEATEEDHRLLQREEMKLDSIRLTIAAKSVGVVEPKDYSIFQDHGYKTLYGDLTSCDSHNRRAKSRWSKRIVFPAAILLGMPPAVYFFCSRGNPRFWEILIGSVLLSLLLGMMSTLLERFMEKGLRNGPWTLVAITTPFLIAFMALLIYSSNRPKNIKAEIPVTYLIDPTTHDLVGHFLGDSDTGMGCYFIAHQVFRCFKESTPKAAAAVDGIFTHPSMGEDPLYLWQMFHDFTEYLVVLYFGSTSTEGATEREKKTHRNEAAQWLAIPNLNIRCEPQPVSQIEGQLKENMFWNIEFGYIARRAQLRFWMPRDTKITLLRKDDTQSSLLTIENKFLRIDIEIQFLVMSSQGDTFLGEWEGGMNTQDSGKPYRMLKTCIYYDVTYKRMRYGYPEMRDHEQWAQDLFSLLERKFSWGNPLVVDWKKAARYSDLFEGASQKKD